MSQNCQNVTCPPVTCCGSYRIDGYCMEECFQVSKDWPSVVLLQRTCHRKYANKDFVKTDPVQLVPFTGTIYRQVEKQWIIDSLSDKNKIWKAVYSLDFLDDPWFTSNQNINCENNRCCAMSYPTESVQFPLCHLKVQGKCTNFFWTMILQGTNCEYYIK